VLFPSLALLHKYGFNESGGQAVNKEVIVEQFPMWGGEDKSCVNLRGSNCAQFLKREGEEKSCAHPGGSSSGQFLKWGGGDESCVNRQGAPAGIEQRIPQTQGEHI